MTTIPSRLASVSAISGSQQIARQRVRALYRDWYRSVSPRRRYCAPLLSAPLALSTHLNFLRPSSYSDQAPQIVSLYALNISPSMIRVKKRADFERHREISDLNVIDMLIFKSRQEYQETMNCWKTEVRVYSGRMAGPGRGGGAGGKRPFVPPSSVGVTALVFPSRTSLDHDSLRKCKLICCLCLNRQAHVMDWFKKWEVSVRPFPFCPPPPIAVPSR